MTYELFVPQRTRYGAPVCTLCGGKVMNGLNCTCAGDAMWLFRASQGRITTTMCKVRDLTDDCDGGTRLRQMQDVNVNHYGIKGGGLYLPANADSILNMVATGRYGAHWNLSYAPVVGKPQDAFAGAFRGNHDVYLSGPGKTAGTIRVGDPGYKAYRDWPRSLLRTAAGFLELSPGTTLNEEAGGGKVYAYVTPPDPVVATWWPDYIEPPGPKATFAVRFDAGTYWHYNEDGTRHGTFTTPNGFTAYGNSRIRVGTRLFGRLITDRPGLLINTGTAARYWSK